MKQSTLNIQTTVKHSFLLSLLFLLALSLQAQQVNYALNVGGTASDQVYDMAVDGSGNAYVIGVTKSQSQTINFNPLGTAANQTPTSAQEVFFAKYNSSGILQWSILLDNGTATSTNEQTGQLAIDSNGDIYIGILFNGTNTNFNPLGTANNLTATGNDFVFAKYNSSGINQWAMRIDGGSGEGLYMDMTTDASNNLYIFGGFNGTNVDFNPLGTATTLTSSGYSFFVVKYNSSGILQLGFAFDGAQNTANASTLVPSIAVDNSGYIYISAAAGAVNVNPLGTAVTLNNSNQTAFLAKYNSSGINQWAFNLGGTRFVGGTGLFSNKVLVDSNSDVYLLSNHTNVNDFNPLGTTMNFGNSPSPRTPFIAKYNSSGIFQWRLALSQENRWAFQDMELDASNNLYTAGSSWTTENFNPLGTATNVNAGKVIAKYNSSGILQNVTSFGTFSFSLNHHIEFDNAGNIYFGGDFSDATVDVDPSTSTSNLSTNGDNDFFLVSYKSIVLPVELTYFKGQTIPNSWDNHLTWQTASEQNNEGFKVQRAVRSGQFAVSSGQLDWQTIGFVHGNGTTTEVSNYEFTDDAIHTGNTYYRLKQIDYDGNFEYSNIIQLATRNPKLKTDIFPNPVQDELTILNGEGNAVIYNLLGQPIREYRISNDEYRMSIEDLPNGQYWLYLQKADGTVQNVPIIKQ